MVPAGLLAGLLLSCVLAQLYLALALRPGHGVGASRLRLRIAAMGTAAWSVAVLAIGPSSDLATSLSPLLSLTLGALWLWQLEPLLAWQGHGPLLRRAATWTGPLLVAGCLVWLAAMSPAPFITGRFYVALSVAALLLCAFALFTLEQLYRNGSREAEPALRWFGLGIGLVLVVELACVALGLLQGHASADLWLLRGLAIAGCAVALVRGTRLMPSWKQGISLSRQVVFFASSFVVVGLYLLAMSLARWALVRSGIDWSPWLSWTFVVVASAALAIALHARRLLPRFSVFISSHFFAQRYDYRAEWLRFSRTLVDDAEPSLQRRALRAVAQIVKSPQAQLFWRAGQGTRYERVASTAQAEGTARSVAADHALPAFLARTQWLVDLAELQRRPDLYDDLRLDRAEISASADALVVPLLLGEMLHGWMVLDRGEQVRELDFEDRDLLKVAGRQVAAHLAQNDADAELAQGRQFETYNRMTVFVMHDLKNVAAQLRLVTQNAERHRQNPAFVDDAFRTVAAAATRMGKLISQLSAGRPEGATLQTLDLANCAERAVKRCAQSLPVPQVVARDRPVVLADMERLTAIIEHGIRNAQDATPDGGEVRVEVLQDSGGPVLRIVDSGCGMDEEFVRERLFRPFDTTKGPRGMGIGAFQIRDYLRSLGGALDVQSAPGRGTTLTFTFPELPAQALSRAG